VGSKRQGENFKCVMWMAAGGMEGKHSKMKEKKCRGDEEKGGGGLKENNE
jgi:hypothetical protein